MRRPLQQTARSTRTRSVRRASFPREARARVQSVLLGQVLGRVETGFRVRVGGEEQTASLDPSVDPALLAEAVRTGARAVLEPSEGGGLVLVGLLTTQRAVGVSRTGEVNAHVRRWRVTADEELLMKSSGAFLQLKLDEAELYAGRVLCRARELTRLLGRMIKLN